MERKLYTAAQDLPQPETHFDTIRTEALNRRPAPKVHRFPIRRAVALAAVFLLVFTFTAAGYRYDQIQRSMWVLYYERDWDAAQYAIDDFDLVLPETLMGYSFHCQSEYSVVPRDTPLMQAMLTEFYRPISISYAHYTPRGGLVPSVDEWGPYIDVGSTDSPYWKHYFSIGGDGLVSHEHVVPGSMQVVTYNGTAIQLYLTEYHYDDGTHAGPYAHALWIDESRECCILLDTHADDLTAALDTARQLMDANP